MQPSLDSTGFWTSRTSREATLEDEATFRECYTTHGPSVYLAALVILRNPEAAHDVVHDVFLRAWGRPNQYDPTRGNAGVWLRAVARNLSIDRLSRPNDG